MADTTSLHLRLPKGLYKRLQRQAKRNHVSLNTEIVNQLSHPEDPRIGAHLQKAIGGLEGKIAGLIKDATVEIEGFMEPITVALPRLESLRRTQDIVTAAKGEEKK